MITLTAANSTARPTDTSKACFITMPCHHQHLPHRPYSSTLITTPCCFTPAGELPEYDGPDGLMDLLQGIADFDGSGLGSIPYLNLPEGLKEAALPGSDGSLAAPKAGRQGSGAGRAGSGPGVLWTKKAGARVPRVRRPRSRLMRL